MKTLKNTLYKMIKNRADILLEKDLNEEAAGKYYVGTDTDTVDIGVGRVTVREDILQDEEKAFYDAKEQILNEFKKGDFQEVFDLFDDENFCRAFIKIFERI